MRRREAEEFARLAEKHLTGDEETAALVRAACARLLQVTPRPGVSFRDEAGHPVPHKPCGRCGLAAPPARRGGRAGSPRDGVVGSPVHLACLAAARPIVPGDRKDRIPLGCWDCDRQTGPYQVRDEVWAAAFPGYAGLKAALRDAYRDTEWDVFRCVLLCFACLERRLGRALVLRDFTDRGVNDGVFLGARLGGDSARSGGLLVRAP